MTTILTNSIEFTPGLPGQSAAQIKDEFCVGEECPYFNGGTVFAPENQLHYCSGPYTLNEGVAALLAQAYAEGNKPAEIEPYPRPCLDI